MFASWAVNVIAMHRFAGASRVLLACLQVQYFQVTDDNRGMVDLFGYVTITFDTTNPLSAPANPVRVS
jgi:hypothetical protein